MSTRSSRMPRSPGYRKKAKDIEWTQPPDDEASEWVEFPANFTSHLSYTITILYKQRDTLRSFAGGFIVQLLSMLDQECNLIAASISEMRSLDNTQLRAAYDFGLMKEVTNPLDDIERCLHAIQHKIMRLQAPLPDTLAPNRLPDVLDIYDLFVACHQDLKNVNTILTRARRLTTRLEPVTVQDTSDLTLKVLFETCYDGAMMLTENRLEEKPDGWKALNLAIRLRNWGDTIFEAKPFPLDELFALDPEGTQICRAMLVPNFLRILVYLGKQVLFAPWLFTYHFQNDAFEHAWFESQVAPRK